MAVALAVSAIESDSAIITWDYESGDADTTSIAGQLDLYNHLLGFSSLAGDTMISTSRMLFVEAGQTVTLRFQVGAVDTTGGEIEEEFLIRNLGMTFTPGGTGLVDPLTEDELPTMRRAGALPNIFED